MDTGVIIFTAEKYASQSLVKKENTASYSLALSEICTVIYLLSS